jgi:hypothetical protein
MQLAQNLLNYVGQKERSRLAQVATILICIMEVLGSDSGLAMTMLTENLHGSPQPLPKNDESVL